jgi:hypothetical protein
MSGVMAGASESRPKDTTRYVTTIWREERKAKHLEIKTLESSVKPNANK